MEVTIPKVEAGGSIAIGLIYDRCAPEQQPLAGCFLVDDGLVVSVASVLAPYKCNPQALKIVLLNSPTEYAVKAITLHQYFDSPEAIRAWLGGSPPPPKARVYDCCFLHMDTEFQSLSPAQIETVSEALRFPLDLNNEGFRGNFCDIDLPLVLQTLSSAQRDGILYLCDDLMRPLAQIFCLKGKVVTAQYKNLWNEMAIYQIVEKDIATKFAFHPSTNQGTWPHAMLNRSSDTLLLEGYRRLDELQRIRSGLTAGISTFARKTEQCDDSDLADEAKPFALKLFQTLDEITPTDDLWMVLGCDDYTVYRTLFELSRSGQIVSVGNHAADSDPTEATDDINEFILSENELDDKCSITSISIEPASMRLIKKVGEVVADRGSNTTYLNHNIHLPLAAAGSPIFQNNEIVGMHSRSMTGHLGLEASQMLTLDVILALKDDRTKIMKTYETPKVPDFVSEQYVTANGEIFSPLRTLDQATTPLTPAATANKSARKFLATIAWFIGGYLLVLAISNLAAFINGINNQTSNQANTPTEVNEQPKKGK
ncbi:MAG: DUF4388 domain-containing protein [Candidatus Obscuribacterales bacterium]